MNIKPITIVDKLLVINNMIHIDGHWYAQKPMQKYYARRNFLMRIRDAFAVLCNRAIAVQFAEDQLGKKS